MVSYKMKIPCKVSCKKKLPRSAVNSRLRCLVDVHQRLHHSRLIDGGRIHYWRCIRRAEVTSWKHFTYISTGIAVAHHGAICFSCITKIGSFGMVSCDSFVTTIHEEEITTARYEFYIHGCTHAKCTPDTIELNLGCVLGSLSQLH